MLADLDQAAASRRVPLACSPLKLAPERDAVRWAAQSAQLRPGSCVCPRLFAAYQSPHRGKTLSNRCASGWMTTTSLSTALNERCLPFEANRQDAHRLIDRRAVERAARDLLAALGADLGSEGLRDTPRRMADAYTELLTPQPFSLTTFPNDEGYDELVVVRDIPFHSLCMHHVLPFHGVAHVAYLPAERILGLSKLARVVELFARDLQLQERLTTQVASWLQEQLQPKGVGVVLEAEHLCMSLRGVQKPGAKTVTSALHGLVRDDPRTRAEFLNLTGGGTR
jgi:GTP cyclohydrolase I